MTPEVLIGIVIAALVIYLIATHKIDLSKIEGRLQEQLGKIHATAVATHAAALSPVSVVVARSDSTVLPSSDFASASHTPPPTHDDIRQIVNDALAAAPAGSSVANNAGNTSLAGYAASGDARGGNAGGNVTDQLQSDAAAAAEVEHRSPAFDPASPNSVRYFDGDAGASVTKRYTATQSGTLEVNIGERPGNEAGVVDFSMSGPGVSVSWRGCHLSFDDKVPGIQAGASYDLMITAAAKFATDVRAGMLPA